jgi:hypothetical protein
MTTRYLEYDIAALRHEACELSLDEARTLCPWVAPTAIAEALDLGRWRSGDFLSNPDAISIHIARLAALGWKTVQVTRHFSGVVAFLIESDRATRELPRVSDGGEV